MQTSTKIAHKQIIAQIRQDMVIDHGRVVLDTEEFGEIVWEDGRFWTDDHDPANSLLQKKAEEIREAVFEEIEECNNDEQAIKAQIEQLERELHDLNKDRRIYRRAIDSGV